jgi:molybdopterin-guanine dinucleotide biosynthesis protein B
MKVFSVCGVSNSGKTATIEKIIKELTRRGYKTGSVKEIHSDKFQIDPDGGSDTRRHREAGSGLVTARGFYETDVLFPSKLSMEKIFAFYRDFDFVALEGVSDIPVPAIVTAQGAEDLKRKMTNTTFCISGKISGELREYEGVPVINAIDNCKSLVDLIETKSLILSGNNNIVNLSMGGEEIKMVPFVQKTIKNVIIGLVRELDGYKEGAEIRIELK